VERSRMPDIRRCREDEQPALLHIVNSAAEKYRGVIPADCWHEPYMSAEELAAELAAGVEFWGAELDDVLVGIMGVQQILDADLIRHAYVLPAFQGKGIGGLLLTKLCAEGSRPILIGTWAAANWAIEFYKHHGFRVVGGDQVRILLNRYWTVSDRQIEASVVLRMR
jgi:GNAT superfamily N-acetyltransferase